MLWELIELFPGERECAWNAPDLLWVWPLASRGPENAEPAHLGDFCSRSTCLGIFLTTSWFRLHSGKGFKRQRSPGPSWSCHPVGGSTGILCLAGCWLSLLGSTADEREYFCSLSPSNLLITQHWISAHSPYLDVGRASSRMCVWSRRSQRPS